MCIEKKTWWWCEKWKWAKRYAEVEVNIARCNSDSRCKTLSRKKEKDGYCKRECVWVKEEKKTTTNKTDWNGLNFHNLLLKCSLHSMYMMLYARTHIHFYTKSKCRRMNETKRCGDLLIATQRLAFHFIMVTRVRRRAHFYSLICIYDQLLHFSESHTYF